MIVLVSLLSFSGHLVVARELKGNAANEIYISDVNNAISVDISPQHSGFIEFDDAKCAAHCKIYIRHSNHTVTVNIAGIPALSMPCGRDKDGLPIGMHLMGKAFSEPLLYRAGFAFEQEKGRLF